MRPFRLALVWLLILSPIITRLLPTLEQRIYWRIAMLALGVALTL